jgi:DNA/RNA-binding domain of Phe-tRNA-synthetase-like protein
MQVAGDRLTGADAIGTRSESTPWAYRVLARRLGIDPDAAENPVETAALHRAHPAAGGSLPQDAQLIAVAETGVPVLAFDADRLDGELWLRRAAPGERVGAGSGQAIAPGRPVLADRTRVVAVPFGPADAATTIGPETERMTFVALQVKGVPDVGVEEALWTVVEIARASR